MRRRLIVELADKFGQDGTQLGVRPVVGGKYHFRVLSCAGLRWSSVRTQTAFRNEILPGNITKGVVLITVLYYYYLPNTR